MNVAAPEAVASPLPLLQDLAEHVSDGWITAALARRRPELEAILAQQRQGGSWDAAAALRQAHLWLVAGVTGRGDDLVLEAHALAPEAGLIPDWWGLWPAQRADAALQALAASYISLRHLEPLEAWRSWLTAVQQQRSAIDTAAMRLLLGLVIHGRSQLPGPLEPALEQLVGEELVASEPALAWRLFDPLCERLPRWAYGRLKAADLSLQRGELERCQQHLDAATADQWQLAWLHDIAARLALAQGDVAAALSRWQTAIERCQSDGDGQGLAAVVELFRQRAREARRGPGVLQARSLLNRGDTTAAVALLEHLLQQDPQWQPLRSLLEQARQPQGSAAAATASSGDLARLESRLQELARRAELPWPQPATAAGPADPAAFEQVVHRSLGRLALLG